MTNDRHVIAGFEGEYATLKRNADKAIAQLDAAQIRLNGVSVAGLSPLNANSVAVIMKHMGGNLRSRFTDLLSSDGEKPWRDRDSEFIDDFPPGETGRSAALGTWDAGWSCLLQSLATLSDADLSRTITIRGEAHTVARALTRSLAHAGYHVGQIILLSRAIVGDERWNVISVPRGASRSFNASMGFDAQLAPADPGAVAQSPGHEPP